MTDDNFRIRPVSEDDLDLVFEAAGGGRAHADADRRRQPGADYRLFEAVVELKVLDDAGLAKSERQDKLAALFSEEAGERPVIVLDRKRLSPEGQRRYDRIVEGPIKGALAKARKQLKQSRAEFADASCSVLFLINNGYTALDHQELVRLAAHRVRQDTEGIDALVVAGCYFHGDTLDNYFLWFMECVPIHVDRPFRSFEALRQAWNDYVGQFMTALARGSLGPAALTGPIVDTHFDRHGVTYVKPAPPIGGRSGFFLRGRPRNDSSGLDGCPMVAVTFPDLTIGEWRLFKAAIPDDPGLLQTYEEWRSHRQRAARTGTPLQPFVALPIAYVDWERWRSQNDRRRSAALLSEFANLLFDAKAKAIIHAARERKARSVLPHRYVMAITEVIGQDRANDVSRIAYVRERLDGGRAIRPVVMNACVFHEHALAIASAYAVAEGLDTVLWEKDLVYAWT